MRWNLKTKTTVLPDEFIAHRAGMILLVITCLGSCQNCSIQLVLNVGSHENRIMDITSNQLDLVVLVEDTIGGRR
jgi:hypothetical protein